MDPVKYDYDELLARLRRDHVVISKREFRIAIVLITVIILVAGFSTVWQSIQQAKAIAADKFALYGVESKIGDINKAHAFLSDGAPVGRLNAMQSDIEHIAAFVGDLGNGHAGLFEQHTSASSAGHAPRIKDWAEPSKEEMRERVNSIRSRADDLVSRVRRTPLDLRDSGIANSVNDQN